MAASLHMACAQPRDFSAVLCIKPRVELRKDQTLIVTVRDCDVGLLAYQRLNLEKRISLLAGCCLYHHTLPRVVPPRAEIHIELSDCEEERVFGVACLTVHVCRVIWGSSLNLEECTVQFNSRDHKFEIENIFTNEALMQANPPFTRIGERDFRLQLRKVL